MISRRSWIQRLGAVGAGSLLLSPTEILASIPDEPDRNEKSVWLATNENPYAPSPAMTQAINNMGNVICRYPFKKISALQKQIAEYEGVAEEHVIVTSGSREGLNAVGLIKAIEGGEIACCLPTYLALLNYAEHWGAKLRVSPLTDKLEYNLPAIEKSVNENTSLVFVCNPNNPTGTIVDSKELEAFARRVSDKTTVFIDEVYFDYVEIPNHPSMKHLVVEGKDVVIARTLSKVYGLAGVRIGYMLANKEMAAKMRKAQMSGTNIYGATLGAVALKDKQFKAFSLQKNKECKEMIYKALEELNLEYLQSHTNFVFFKTAKPIEDVRIAFESEGVTVGRAFPPYTEWCRISTGTTEEVAYFVKVLKKVFA